ncbi:MAG: transglutaminase domain-containing protein [Planctomycetes bacterium]|uniref:transglutaminase domain-containing protein n=1 Tax=Candidatus Wunengus californicus TaxID=3367619 RepID=UPI004024EA43|nr:transglutaminase domain-containing protein [Planctomycetota bacterium]
MKRSLSITGFFIISLIILAGCHSAQYTEFINKKVPNQLETSLINDIQDGRLAMPYEQACLIASGVNSDKKMKSYLTKIDALISRINRETGINNTIDPLTKAQLIFDWLQRNANEGTYNDCYDIRDTLNLKVGNCLSYAIRFTIICNRFGIDIKNIFIPGHIYNMLLVEKQEHYFEHTHSDGIVKNADSDHPQKKIMNDLELIAEIFLYKARNANNEMKHEKSIKYCQQALTCNPYDNRPVILLLDNYIAKKRYEEAFRYLNDYISHHPDDKKTFKNTYTLLQRLCKKGDNKL